MSDIRSTPKNKLYRLWSVPLLAAGILFLARGMGDEQLASSLLGAGMVLGGVFSFRHNLLDQSAAALDLRQVGIGWASLLGTSVLLILAAAVVVLTA